jgi:hypothetical protein
MSVAPIDGSVFCRYNPGMAKKKKPGRPKGRSKPDILQVRVSPVEKQAFADAAKADGKGVSEWVRDRLRRLAREELAHAGRPDPFRA